MVEDDGRAAWERIQSEFPITATRSYLFAGGLAPLSTPALAEIDRYSALWARDPVSAYRDHSRDQADLLRAEIAVTIGAQPVDVAIVDSTSRGNNLAAQMVEAVPGSNVIVDSTTYPTARYPWLLREGVEVRDAGAAGEPALAEIRRLVDDRTVAISVSHVCRLSGFRHNLRELAEVAHSVGALLIVDAAQSVGAVRVDVSADQIDFLSFGAMKWLLGVPGVAFFYVRPALQERLRPPHAAAGARVVDGGLVLPAGGARHELSSLNWSGLGACREGLKILARVSPAAVEARVLELSGSVIEGLLERGVRVRTPPDRRLHAGIVAFDCERPEFLSRFMREHGVDVWGWEERRLVRVDPHIYNDETDVARFLDTYDQSCQTTDI